MLKKSYVNKGIISVSLFFLLSFSKSYAALSLMEVKGISAPLKEDAQQFSPAVGFIFNEGRVLESLFPLWQLEKTQEGKKLVEDIITMSLTDPRFLNEGFFLKEMALVKKMMEQTHHQFLGRYILTISPSRFLFYLSPYQLGMLRALLTPGVKLKDELPDLDEVLKNSWADDLKAQSMFRQVAVDYLAILNQLKALPQIQKGPLKEASRAKRNTLVNTLRKSDALVDMLFKDLSKRIQLSDVKVLSLMEDGKTNLLATIEDLLGEKVVASIGEFSKQFEQLKSFVQTSPDSFLAAAYLSSIVAKKLTANKKDLLDYYRGLAETVDWPKGLIPLKDKFELTDWPSRFSLSSSASFDAGDMSLSMEERAFHIKSANNQNWPLTTYVTVGITPSVSFPNCVETAILNFFKILLNKYGDGNYHTSVLDHLAQIIAPGTPNPISKDLYTFFTQFPHFESLKAPEMMASWSKILSGLPDVDYKRSFAEAGSPVGCEIRSGDSNVLLTLSKLLGVPFSSWSNFFDLLAPLGLNITNYAESLIEFDSAQEGSFNWEVGTGHSHIDPVVKDQRVDANYEEVKLFLEQAALTPSLKAIDYLSLSLYPASKIKNNLIANSFFPDKFESLFFTLAPLELDFADRINLSDARVVEAPALSFISLFAKVFQAEIEQSLQTTSTYLKLDPEKVLAFLKIIPSVKRSLFIPLIFKDKDKCQLSTGMQENLEQNGINDYLLKLFLKLDPEGKCTYLIQSEIKKLSPDRFEQLSKLVQSFAHFIQNKKASEITPLHRAVAASLFLRFKELLLLRQGGTETIASAQLVQYFNYLLKTKSLISISCQGSYSSGYLSPTFGQKWGTQILAIFEEIMQDYLITPGTNKNKRDLEHLALAAMSRGDSALAEQIFNIHPPLDFDPSVKDILGKTTLHWAVLWESAYLGEILLDQYNFSPAELDSNQDSPLGLLLKSRKPIDDGFSTPIERLGIQMWEKLASNPSGLSFLKTHIVDKGLTFSSIENGHRILTLEILSQFPLASTLSLAETSHQTVLHQLARSSNGSFADDIKIFNLILSRGGNLNSEDEFGMTPLMYAVSEDRPLWIPLFLAQGADFSRVQQADRTNVFHMAATLFNPDAMDALLSSIPASNAKFQKAINALDWEGNTPLMTALKNNAIDRAQTFLELGADPTIANSNGRNSLELALEKSAPLIFFETMAKHQNFTFRRFFDQPNLQGEYPLQTAFKQKNIALARFLVQQGAKTNITNDRGQSLNDLIQEYGLQGLGFYELIK